VTKRKCFSISTYLQFEELIKLNKNKRKVLIILIKNYLVKGFGADWVNTFIDLIKKNYPEYNIKFFVDCGNDSGLSITFLNEKIDYLKIRSNSIVLKKINQIARKNKVLLNPNFNIVELSKIKNYNNLKL
tara:strand:+ start:335 stop:724 length:390 start_codon:yes stop_codon:yes gene_type:complete